MMKSILVASLLGFPALAAAETDLPSALFDGADVVFLGEVHDNPLHHENQLRWLQALDPAAVVFEMVTPEQAGLVTPENSQNQARLAVALTWADSGWPNFGMYFPLFAFAAPRHVEGAQVPRAAFMDAMRGGDPRAAFDGDPARYGLDRDLPEETQARREAAQLAAHCDALPAEMLPAMVMAQRVRDAAIAAGIDRALAATGGPVAVITGNGHARKDQGAPSLLPPTLTVISIGQVESEAADTGLYDAAVVTPPIERPDPCDAFR